MITTLDGQPFHQPLGKVVCIGRNYAAHAAELNNPIPTEPLLFIKPATSVVEFSAAPLRLPQGEGDVHYEAEMALLIGEPLSHVKPSEALTGIAGVGMALDLTLRDRQSKLKEKGHPWEIAKGWDGACPLTGFIAADRVASWDDLNFSLTINDQLRQQGHTAQMLTPVEHLLAYASQWFTLMPGDVILTGTPEGVGTLHSGDQLKLTLEDWLSESAVVG